MVSKILAIDPGNIESGYCVVDKTSLKPLEVGKINNKELLTKIYQNRDKHLDYAIEMIASYGMGVGKSVFETCVWIGRFMEAIQGEVKFIYRKDVKMNLCHSMKAKDSNITQALVDRFAPGQSNFGKGTKSKPGWFYGFKKDIWSAYAIATTYHDMYVKGDWGYEEVR